MFSSLLNMGLLPLSEEHRQTISDGIRRRYAERRVSDDLPA